MKLSLCTCYDCAMKQVRQLLAGAQVTRHVCCKPFVDSLTCHKCARTVTSLDAMLRHTHPCTSFPKEQVLAASGSALFEPFNATMSAPLSTTCRKCEQPNDVAGSVTRRVESIFLSGYALQCTTCALVLPSWVQFMLHTSLRHFGVDDAFAIVAEQHGKLVTVCEALKPVSSQPAAPQLAPVPPSSTPSTQRPTVCRLYSVNARTQATAAFTSTTTRTDVRQQRKIRLIQRAPVQSLTSTQPRPISIVPLDPPPTTIFNRGQTSLQSHGEPSNVIVLDNDENVSTEPTRSRVVMALPDEGE